MSRKVDISKKEPKVGDTVEFEHHIFGSPRRGTVVEITANGSVRIDAGGPAHWVVSPDRVEVVDP